MNFGKNFVLPKDKRILCFGYLEHLYFPDFIKCWLIIILLIRTYFSDLHNNVVGWFSFLSV